MSAETNNNLSLDNILAEVGEFGVYQVASFLLICAINMLSAASMVNYMISANTLNYRCKVPECDVDENDRGVQYDQPWLKFAIPSTNDKLDSCTYYALRNRTESEIGQCSAEMFDTSKRIECSEYVYASDEKNVQTEFNIHCSDSYKLALIGTVGNIGRFIFLPITGILSDRFGRLPGIIIGTQLASIFGIIKSYSVNYSMYIVFEFLEASAFICCVTGIRVLAIEWVTARCRVLSNTYLSIAYTLGEILLGFVAMYMHDFRYVIRIIYLPGLFVFIYFWLVPESVRWLLITGRVDRAVKILQKIARVNQKELSEKSIEMIKQKYSIDMQTMNNFEKENNKSDPVIQSLCTVFKSKKLCSRFLNCCYQWMAGAFCFYGFSLYATQIPGANRYISFIAVAAGEIPGVIVVQVLLNRMKRRLLLFLMISVASISISITSIIPEKYPWIVLIFFMLGKASITGAFGALYVFTAEQWPTNIRSTIMNSCSMIGRIGSMVSPLTVILGAQYFASLPALLFGASAFVAAILVLFSPETFAKKLPDTIEEAKAL